MIRDHPGRAVAALAVSAPATRMTPPDVERHVRVLTAAAERIGGDLL